MWSASATVRLQEGFIAAGEVAAGVITPLGGDDAERGRALALVRIGPSGVERLPRLPTRLPALREPLPLVSSGGDLIGAAWLEGSGPRRLAVRFAPWEGAAWGPAEEVAPPAAGSQLALTASGTPDGAVLLAWSAFDGEDDEILWSIRKGVSWSPPRRLGADNAVPDITPALHALGGSGSSGDAVLAAWSRYQGDRYRVVVARFDGHTWSEPHPIGPPGSVFPTFEARGETSSATSTGASVPRILFRTAAPRGWHAVEVDRDGFPRRLARVGAETSDRPRLVEDGDALRFVWPEAPDEGEDTPSPSTRAARWENLP